MSDGTRHAQLVGSLLYLWDWTAAKCVLQYLKGTSGMGITYGRAARLDGWVDSNFAGDVETRKSRTGFVFMLHGGAMS